MVKEISGVHYGKEAAVRKVLVAAFVLLAVAGILYAQERIRVRTDIQKKFDRNRDGWLDPHEQEALEKFMRGREKKGNPDEIEQLKRRIHELLGAAEEAEAD